MEGDVWLQTDVLAPMALQDPSVKEVCALKQWKKKFDFQTCLVVV